MARPSGSWNWRLRMMAVLVVAGCVLLVSLPAKFLNRLVPGNTNSTLVKEDGDWKIDQQQVVIASEEFDKWFPESG